MHSWKAFFALGMIFLTFSKYGVHGDDEMQTILTTISNNFKRMSDSIPENPSPQQWQVIMDQISIFRQMVEGIMRQYESWAKFVEGQQQVNAYNKSKRKISAGVDQLRSASTGKNKRIISDLIHMTRQGISTVGQAFQEFLDTLKPVKGKMASIALDVNHAVQGASDQMLNVVVAAG